MTKFLEFSTILSKAPCSPGVYEIRLKSGAFLKVGVAKDLRARLRQHSASRQSGLKLKNGGDWSRPNDVVSKSSILAKHLFFDRSVAPAYNLRLEDGRRKFLAEKCQYRFEIVDDKGKRQSIENAREGTGQFRYVGRVGNL